MTMLKIRNGGFSTNTYLIGDVENGCYVIDPSDSFIRIKNTIDERFGGKIKAILLTHGHLDHIGSVDRLVETYNCSVYLSDLDKIYVDGTLKTFRNNLQEFNIQLKCNTIDAYLINDPNIVVYETPGHTPGSVCYLFKEENSIFVGDTLFKMSVGRTDLYGGSRKDLDNSLKILTKLPDNTKVYCGHEEDTTIGFEKIYNPFIR
ncbi:MAG: MBL fold metallo-hydrolase [Bacilli bacterium]|nr:MBL fold metallo-hydrolase [Bacilli bacterium]